MPILYTKEVHSYHTEIFPQKMSLLEVHGRGWEDGEVGMACLTVADEAFSQSHLFLTDTGSRMGRLGTDLRERTIMRSVKGVRMVHWNRNLCLVVPERNAREVEK